jgi:hypothetical protein
MIDRDARFEKANPAAAAVEEWKSLLAEYSDVVLVANSDEVDIEELKRRFPDTTLFIFFNKVFKVLSEPFTRHSMLFSRSGTLGANLVKSGKVDKVLPYFDTRTFHGVVNIKAGPNEQLSPASDFGGSILGKVRAEIGIGVGRIAADNVDLALAKHQSQQHLLERPVVNIENLIALAALRREAGQRYPGAKIERRQPETERKSRRRHARAGIERREDIRQIEVPDMNVAEIRRRAQLLVGPGLDVNDTVEGARVEIG